MVEKGKLITFEGLDGCGKSTQIGLLAERLGQAGIDFIATREPGGTGVGEQIRKILKDPSVCICPESELLLFLAARAQFVEETVKPALDAGKWVLADRFCDSTVAYQGYGRTLGAGEVGDMDAFARKGVVPDLTFLFDIDAGLSLERAAGRNGTGDRIESAGLTFFSDVRIGFLEIAAAEKDRIRLVDASLGIDEIARVVASEIEKKFGISLNRG